MKILSIDEAFKAVHELRKGGEPLELPEEFRDALQKGLAQRQEGLGGTIGEARRAEDWLNNGPDALMLQRLQRFWRAPSADTASRLLHGGEAGRALVAGDLQKAKVGDREAVQDHKELRKQLALLLRAHGADGCPLEAFKLHVHEHGHRAVARALKDLGAEHCAGKIRRAPATVKPKTPAVEPQKKLTKAWRPLGFRRGTR